MSCLETLLHRAETPPWSAAYRVAIGFSLLPILTWWRDDPGSDWRLPSLFALALVTLRLVPALVRRTLPFSEELQSYWARQRFLAKRFDSYQWRKLVWFGLGLAAHLAAVGRADVVPTGLAVACVLAGGVGALRWRRLTQADQVAAALTRNGSRPAPAVR